MLTEKKSFFTVVRELFLEENDSDTDSEADESEEITDEDDWKYKILY